jgi:hypothetical protein
MKEVTSPARPKWSFPIPVDVETGTGRDYKQDKNEEQALHGKSGERPRKAALRGLAAVTRE